jgi:hypothetical protein
MAEIKTVSPRLDEKTRFFYSSLGGSLNAAAEYVLQAFPGLYRRTLHDMRGRFARAELLLMVDVCNGLWLTPGFAGQHMEAQVTDGIDLDALDKKWGVEKKTILGKLAALSTWEAACLEMWICGFWKTHDRSNLNVESYISSMDAASTSGE